MSSTMKECPVCLEDYKQPKFLSCHHTFCLDCIRSMATSNLIICPLCKRAMTLPKKLTDLTTNFYLDNTPSELVVGWYQTTLEFVFRWGKRHQKHSVHGVTLKFELSKGKTAECGEVLAIDIQLPPARKYFVTSCNIEYDITLINQKSRSISTNQKGQLQLEDKGARVPLIRYKDAMDKHIGFIIRETMHQNNPTPPTKQPRYQNNPTQPTKQPRYQNNQTSQTKQSRHQNNPTQPTKQPRYQNNQPPPTKQPRYKNIPIPPTKQPKHQHNPPPSAKQPRYQNNPPPPTKQPKNLVENFPLCHMKAWTMLSFWIKIQNNMTMKILNKPNLK
ncbi:hypothetical protein LOTGIDRAFT_159688 [Lottia gigantea]|uniref:RING-type domain-containing protein n=1 Tax=Lottia gigantea TaxID=225164 RepID=V3ZZG7_LOTGI|nr:hypothetical protein LOTGIDRAFT_159688 [Lottia gigantea]ESO96933.1 hypothetical protein LOTGIDRAFT_159688 [Lottia gigantea]